MRIRNVSHYIVFFYFPVTVTRYRFGSPMDFCRFGGFNFDFDSHSIFISYIFHTHILFIQREPFRGLEILNGIPMSDLVLCFLLAIISSRIFVGY